MLNKLSKHNKLITCILASAFLVLFLLTLIFTKADGKLRFLVLSLVIPVVVYVFMRLAYKVVFAYATYELARIFIWFFIIGGTIMTVSDTLKCIIDFPNDLSFTLGASMAVIIASLGEAKQLGK